MLQLGTMLSKIRRNRFDRQGYISRVSLIPEVRVDVRKLMTSYVSSDSLHSRLPWLTIGVSGLLVLLRNVQSPTGCIYFERSVTGYIQRLLS
jgi:hypothetical protein